MADELRPCPFCGGEARIFFSREGGMWDVQCQRCGAMPYLVGRQDARGADPAAALARMWNRRGEHERDGSGCWYFRASGCSHAATDTWEAIEAEARERLDDGLHPNDEWMLDLLYRVRGLYGEEG